MADIFMILLVFLLKSHATGATNVNPSAGLRLPEARTDGEQVQALKVEVSENAVQVDDKPVSKLNHFRFDTKDLRARAVSLSLEAAIKMARERQDLIAKSNPEVKSDKRLLIVADQRVPYVTMKTVVLTAALHEFSDLKLVVVKKN
jgi:biopolymer transport protein ExbD